MSAETLPQCDEDFSVAECNSWEESGIRSLRPSVVGSGGGDAVKDCALGPRRIALLAPYDGGNLGDSAIQEALIANLRCHDPEIELCGVTLDPERTSQRHGIQCFPVASKSVSHYQVTTLRREGVAAEGAAASGESAPTTLYRRLRRLARRIFLLVWIRALFLEGLHLIRSYRFLRDVSALVIAGGGQLDDEWGGSWGHPYALMKWSLLARAAGSSVLFLSVGACRLESWLTRMFLRMALSSACYRSYRDEESRRLALAITPSAEGTVVPDIAFSLQTSLRNSLETERVPLHVGVSPIAYGRAGLWPTPNTVQYERYLAELADFVTSLLKSGASVTLFSSSPPDDQVFDDLRRRVSGVAAENALRAHIPTTVHELLEALRSFDVVVASRLHGVLLSFLVGTPAVAVSYDRKVSRLMEDLKLKEYCVDIRTFEREILVKVFSSLRENRKPVISSVAATCQRYDALLRQQYCLVAGLAGGHRPTAQRQEQVLSSHNL
jgi:polysaccharide pyruvyl transferase WcaK-like protein